MQKNLKILHVGNTGGVASVLAKFMDRFFHSSSFVVVRKRYHPYGLTRYRVCWNLPSSLFKLRTMWTARHYSIIHLHGGLDELAPLMNLLYPNKPIVIHYHGDDIHNKWRLKKKYWGKANLIIVSTFDLLKNGPKRAVHLPNPVDTDLFRPSSIQKPNSALHLSQRADDLAMKIAEERGLTITIRKRNMSHEHLAKFLSQYEYYIDVKRGLDGRIRSVLSRIGLEALAAGCKVIRWNGKVLQELPSKHRPENVVRLLRNLYDVVIKRYQR